MWEMMDKEPKKEALWGFFTLLGTRKILCSGEAGFAITPRLKDDTYMVAKLPLVRIIQIEIVWKGSVCLCARQQENITSTYDLDLLK